MAVSRDKIGERAADIYCDVLQSPLLLTVVERFA
jgi:hypothetical protein